MALDTPDFETLDVSLHPDDDRICRIHLDNPDRYNILDLDVISELNTAIRAADRTGAVQGIILGSSSDDVFCAGGDIGELAALSIEEGNRFLSTYSDTIDLMWGTGKPIVAAVTGDCVGGGNELAMACDLVVGSESARFGQPEVGVGSTAAAGGVQMMPLMVGMQRAKDLLLTGRLLSAEEAEDWGLINRVVPDDEVRSRSLDIVQTILDESSPTAYRVMKGMFEAWHNRAMSNSAIDRELTAAVWNAEEFGERAQAFLDKEEPEPRTFTGTAPSQD